MNIEKDSYWANVKRATEFELDYMLSKAGKPVDRDEWGNDSADCQCIL